MTKKEYERYQKRVEQFFADGLNNLSTVSSEEGNCEPYFTWKSCPVCGQSKGHDGYDCNGYNGQTKEIEEYSNVCQDCVYYCEYGQLDDQQMWDIEHEQPEEEVSSNRWPNVEDTDYPHQ